MVTGKNLSFTIIYISCLIICASLKEIHTIVRGVDATKFRGLTDGRVQLHMPPRNSKEDNVTSLNTLWVLIYVAFICILEENQHLNKILLSSGQNVFLPSQYNCHNKLGGDKTKH
jgi:hypothetical protein